MRSHEPADEKQSEGYGSGHDRGSTEISFSFREMVQRRKFSVLSQPTHFKIHRSQDPPDRGQRPISQRRKDQAMAQRQGTSD